MTKIPRSQDEILARIRELQGGDVTGIERSRLLQALDLPAAREFLHQLAEWTEETWNAQRLVTERDVLGRITKSGPPLGIIGYLPVAWGYANAQKAMSAVRSLAHFSGLLWLLGSRADDVREELTPLEDAHRIYHPWYGKLALVAVSQFVDYPWQDGVFDAADPKDAVVHDDGLWVRDHGAKPISRAEALAEEGY